METVDWRVHTLTPSLREIERVRCIQVGAGGTGSWVARLMAGVHVARRDAQRAGIEFPLWALGRLPWDLVLVDPDIVDAKNVGRQAFGYDAIGAYKAQVLADDLGRTHRLSYEVHCLPFGPAMLREEPHTLIVLVGCVDNSAARAAMHATLARPQPFYHSGLLYLDAGNGRDTGQVLIGNTAEAHWLRGMFNPVGLTDRAPAPTLLEPDLMATPDRPLSRYLRDPEDDCAARVLRGEQSVTINMLVAVAMVQALTDLITGRVTYLGMDIDATRGIRCLPMEPSAATLAAKLTGGARTPEELQLVTRHHEAVAMGAGARTAPPFAVEDDEELGGEVIDPLAREAGVAAEVAAAPVPSEPLPGAPPPPAATRPARRKHRLRAHKADLRRTQAAEGGIAPSRQRTRRPTPRRRSAVDPGTNATRGESHGQTA